MFVPASGYQEISCRTCGITNDIFV